MANFKKASKCSQKSPIREKKFKRKLVFLYNIYNTLKVAHHLKNFQILISSHFFKFFCFSYEANCLIGFCLEMINEYIFKFPFSLEKKIIK